MAPIAAEGPHLETGDGGGQAGHRGHVSAGELGAPLQLGRLAGYYVTQQPPHLAASVIYEEERKKRDSWGGDSWDNYLAAHGGRQVGIAGRGRLVEPGRRKRMGEEKERKMKKMKKKMKEIRQAG